MNSHVLFLAILLWNLALAGVATSDITPANVEESGWPQVETTRIDIDRLGRIEELVEAAIANDELPGAVVLVGTLNGVVYQRAFGNRAVESEVEPMSLDTVFDLASLTKVVATTTSVMMLVEEGRIRLADRVEAHLPGFGRLGKGGITVGHLLTHMSGLRPDVDLADPWVGYDTAISLAFDEVPTSAPGERFVYSDINFFLLGEIVARISGLTLDQFVAERIFEPLGMEDTGFNPPAALIPRIAPTERCSQYGWPCDTPDASMLRGTVHDPTARRMQGVAGHAGLFSTAADLAVFCRMLLAGGIHDDVRVLSPLTVARMTTVSTPPDQPNRRGLGWDMDSVFSSNRGELFPPGSFGHTGFTGTSLWIDPSSGVFVVFMSSRLHPDGRGNVTPLRARTATAVAAAIRNLGSRDVRGSDWGGRNLWDRPATRRVRTQPVMTGIDVLVAEGFASLAGKRVGLVTNHTGRSRDGETTIDLLHEADDLDLIALFSPEHGIRGILEASIPSSTDSVTGLPIHSLYGETRRPTPDLLSDLDVIVVDLQDVGTRFYTYATTMAYVMEEAARADVEVVVLDRPNPIDGIHIEGPLLDEGTESFTAYFRMPIRHGLTLGELARLFNDEAEIGARLEVVAMTGWQRDQWFDETGLPWINPSPNMRNLTEATLYPGIGAIETTNLSVGRGTDTPFEQIGAPWIDGVRLASELNDSNLAGIRFYPVSFTPSASKYDGEGCQGVFMIVTDRQAVRPVHVGIEIAAALYRLYPSVFDLDRADPLLRSADTLRRIRLGEDPRQIAQTWNAGLASWRNLRSRYLIYR